MDIERTKKHYVNNANLLEEIEKSKLTFCCCPDKKFQKYDVVCISYDMITPNMIKETFDKDKTKKEVVIRVLTNDHVIPYCGSKKGKLNLKTIKMKPFKHFVLTRRQFDNIIDKTTSNSGKIERRHKKIDGLKEQIKENNRQLRFFKDSKTKQIPFKDSNKELLKEILKNTEEIKSETNNFSLLVFKGMKEVLRSHWKGKTIDEGEFSVEHGKLTDNLVRMLILLADRYAKSGQWSGYTYLDDMKSLAAAHMSEIVLKFEEIKSNNPFSYLTQCAQNTFKSVLVKEKKQRRVKSALLQRLGYDPTFSEVIEDEYSRREEEETKGMEEESSEE